jgi:hypothetical protein
MPLISNVHERFFAHAPDAVRPWLDRAWTGGPEDVFPHDRFRPWRGRPGGPPVPWVPGRTRFGHATLRFRLREWNGMRWQADILSRRFVGSHVFTLLPHREGTLLVHALEGVWKGRMPWIWRFAWKPVHDWAVEAMFDRLEHALRTGEPPPVTERPMSLRAAFGMRFLDRVTRGRLRRGPPPRPASGPAWGA